MGNEFRYMGLVETRRLLSLIGAIVGLFLFVQYFVLPYSTFLSFLFAPGKSQVESMYKFSSGNSSSNLATCRNLTYSDSLNSSNGPIYCSPQGNSTTIFDGLMSPQGVPGGKDSDLINSKDELDGENNKNFDESLDYEVDAEDEFSAKGSLEMVHNSTTEKVGRNESFPLKKHREGDQELRESESNEGKIHNHDIPTAGELGATFSSPPNPPSSDSHMDNSSQITSAVKAVETRLEDNESANIQIAGASVPVNDSSDISIPSTKEEVKGPEPKVISISEMQDMLLQSHASYRAEKKPRWSSRADRELLHMKSLITNASMIIEDPQLDGSLYRNFSEFRRSYELMEQTLKVYIYTEGESPIFHQPPLKGIYASEGWFMKLLKSNKRFVTRDPNKAHLFYLPFSSRNLEEALYVPNSHSRDNLVEHLGKFIEIIKTKYNFWNRTGGADHFLVACHDWAPAETREIMADCIRALCNADVKEGFQFGKDASLPETSIQNTKNPLRQLGGKPPSQRQILAFFAGRMHGYVRPILLNYWTNKDPDMKIFGRISKAKGKMTYAQYMKSSKYCICARGYEVNSPRVVEAISFECVPVIISDNFVPPFFETMNWESFAVFILEKDIPNLKNILLSIPKKRYLKMQLRVKQVQQHFLWHSRPVKYDIFHMILHSMWYNRVFLTRSYLF